MLRRLVDLDFSYFHGTYLEGVLTHWRTIYVRKIQQAELQRHTAIYNLLVVSNTDSYVNVDKFDAISAHVILPIKFSYVKR